MRTLESRLRELVKSVEYQKDFREIKKSILLLKEQKKRIKGTPPICFTRIATPKPQDTAVRHERISLKELQGLLRKGSVNDHPIQIPDVYSDFKGKDRLKLRYFFDPAKPYPKFNPFDDKPIVVQLPLDGGTRITMIVDISYPAGILENMLRNEIRKLKEMWELKAEKGAKQYSKSEIGEVKKLLREGLKGIQIFKRMNPEYKSFNPREDYLFVPEDEEIDGKKVSQGRNFGKVPWKKYIRTLRLIERAKGKNL